MRVGEDRLGASGGSTCRAERTGGTGQNNRSVEPDVWQTKLVYAAFTTSLALVAGFFSFAAGLGEGR